MTGTCSPNPSPTSNPSPYILHSILFYILIRSINRRIIRVFYIPGTTSDQAVCLQSDYIKSIQSLLYLILQSTNYTDNDGNNIYEIINLFLNYIICSNCISITAYKLMKEVSSLL
jgi:hypothetical protein